MAERQETRESGSIGLLSRTWRRIAESSHDRMLRESAEDHVRRHPDEPVIEIDSCTPGEEVTLAGTGIDLDNGLDSCTPGEEVTLAGTVAALDNGSERSTPALEVELADGTGRVFVVWLGRKRIPGIHEGRRMVVHGRLNCVSEHPTIYNPRYELLPE